MFRASRLVTFLQMISVALGFSIRDFEELEEWRRAVGGPAPNQNPGTPDVCKKDILILLDTSNSIGANHFDNDVKPFLESLAKSPKLNVGPDATRLSLITFSDDQNTKLRLPFGAYTKQDYMDFFKNQLQWKSVHGPRTMTGTAIKIANDTVFSQVSPLNARPNVADVAILMTDGEPRGRRKNDQLNLALKYSSSLKNKSILIVGIAVGYPSIVKKFYQVILTMATSRSTMFNSEFDDLDKILNQLVDASCTPFKPGDCDCPSIHSQDVYIQPSQSTVNVSWVQPTLKCRKNKVPNFVSTTVSPNIVSPHAFRVGDHDIEYTYTFGGGFDLKCHVKIYVKSCTCPSLSPVTAYVTSDAGLATVRWVAPVPSCSSTLKAIQPNNPSGSNFALGSHTVNYVYSTVAGFNLTCGIDINIQKCSCQSTKIAGVLYMNPDSPNNKMSVNWIEPKPDCPGQSIQSVTIFPSNIKPGASFGIGLHSVWYTYVMNGGMRLQCSATFKVNVVPCGGTDYKPTTHMCCCGKVQSKRTNNKCCGRKSYDSTIFKCCPLNYNVVNKIDNCPGETVSV